MRAHCIFPAKNGSEYFSRCIVWRRHLLMNVWMAADLIKSFETCIRMCVYFVHRIEVRAPETSPSSSHSFVPSAWNHNARIHFAFRSRNFQTNKWQTSIRSIMMRRDRFELTDAGPTPHHTCDKRFQLNYKRLRRCSSTAVASAVRVCFCLCRTIIPSTTKRLVEIGRCRCRHPIAHLPVLCESTSIQKRKTRMQTMSIK